jgi:uncharacterized membrane protein YoaK (UPF0700 family)
MTGNLVLFGLTIGGGQTAASRLAAGVPLFAIGIVVLSAARSSVLGQDAGE